MALEKKELEEWLAEVDYSFTGYKPTQFALEFVTFIKLVNGEQGEGNKTPVVHLKMLDKLTTRSKRIVNLLFRGAAKTTLFMEYFTLYLAWHHTLPGFGPVEGLIYISDSMENGAKNARKNIEFRYQNSEFLKRWIPEAKFTDSYLEFKNASGDVLGVKLYGATTGIRGTKIFGKRPTIAILDDLMSDEAATSPTMMKSIENTIYKGVNYALDPTHYKIIFNGTPFNKNDVIIKAVESGQWDVNVWPVAERFPCEKEEFRGAWPDRFPYEAIKEQYDVALGTGNVDAFFQELMLVIANDEDRLVQDDDIQWYDRKNLLVNRNNFNFYITTDFATSSKQKADNSVISVWAYSANKHWFWVDGICAKQSMDKTIDALFKLCQEYSPQEVGIETTGQQGGFIPWIKNEMINRNIWFNLAKTGTKEGIHPTVDKISRFNLVTPWFKAGKIHFPEQMKKSIIIGEFLRELRLTTRNGVKGHDDCIDTISMLASLKPWEPSASTQKILVPTAGDMYAEPEEEPILTLDNYIV